MSIKETIAAADDLPSEVVTVEEWGGVKLLLRALAGPDFPWFMRTMNAVGQTETDQLEFALTCSSELIQRGAWDPDNPTARVFDPEDIAGVLDLKSFNVRQRIALKVIALSTPSSLEISEEKKDSSPESIADSVTS